MKKILSLTLATVLILMSLFSLFACGADDACVYFTERDNEGRDIKYAKIEFRDYGTVYLLLDATAAPCTVENFLKLANKGFYNGLTMHRVMSNFMIQGGDPNADGTGGSGENIYGEFSATGYTKNDINHLRGVISMARGDDYFSASSQFFICNADYPSLNGDYAAFGYVISGMSVVDKITQKTVRYADATSGAIADKSKQAVIKSITQVNADEALAAANG